MRSEDTAEVTKQTKSQRDVPTTVEMRTGTRKSRFWVISNTMTADDSVRVPPAAMAAIPAMV